MVEILQVEDQSDSNGTHFYAICKKQGNIEGVVGATVLVESHKQ